jgi:hypothetical protein
VRPQTPWAPRGQGNEEWHKHIETGLHPSGIRGGNRLNADDLLNLDLVI